MGRRPREPHRGHKAALLWDKHLQANKSAGGRGSGHPRSDTPAELSSCTEPAADGRWGGRAEEQWGQERARLATMGIREHAKIGAKEI